MSLRRSSHRLVRDGRILLLLAALPVVAYAPAWWNARLLGPGDGAALHYPLRAAAWEELRAGRLPDWNHYAFSGSPLLAAYRPGALYPPMLALAGLPPFLAFQLLVLGSLAATGVLVFIYLRRLKCHAVGSYFGALAFVLGPYLVGHLGDTATLVAAPLLPLVLLTAERYVTSASLRAAAGLAMSFALLLLSGSPEAVRAGTALIAGRLLVGHLMRPSSAVELRPAVSIAAIALGACLAAPQLLPTLLAAGAAGLQVTGIARDGAGDLPGATGLVLRYVSHTPAPALALAALPLLLRQTPVKVLAAAMALCLALQWGRGPLAAPGALALVFDLTLAILAGLSLSAQWRSRLEPRGATLRTNLLVWCLASAAALSVAAATLGPLPQDLAGPVGVLALSLILYFRLATSRKPSHAQLWLLPLTLSFLLQPAGRNVWVGTPERAELEQGTPTRQAIDAAMAVRPMARELTLTDAWPHERELDLAYGNLAALAGRRSANGYDPMVSLRQRALFDGMNGGGVLPARFLASDPRRLDALGVRWIQVPSDRLAHPLRREEREVPLAVAVETGRARFLPLPIVTAQQLEIVVADGTAIPDAFFARVHVRLATGRLLPVRTPTPDPGRAPQKLRLELPGRYLIDGLRIDAGEPAVTITSISISDPETQTAYAITPLSAFVSDTSRFREAAVTTLVRLFEVVTSPGSAWVVGSLWQLPSDEAVLGGLAGPGFDPRSEAIVRGDAGQGVELPNGSTAGRAWLAGARGGSLDVRAEGPGLLVVAEGWSPGWSATVDGEPTRVLRVNHAQLGLVLQRGLHRVVLRHVSPGWRAGLWLAGLGVLATLWALAARGGSAPRREREMFRQIKAPGPRNTGSIAGFRQRRAGGKEPLSSRSDFRHGLLGRSRAPSL